jgi:hypothetical protein
LPHLLLVTDHCFWLRNRGDRQRISSLIYHLSSHSLITLLYLSDKPLSNQERCQIQQEYRIKSFLEFPINLASSSLTLNLILLLYQGNALLCRKITSKAVWICSSFFDTASRLSRGNYLGITFLKPHFLGLLRLIHKLPCIHLPKFDVVIIEYLRLTNISHHLRHVYPQAKFLIDTHDVLYLREKAFRKYGFSTGDPIDKDQEKVLLSNYEAIIGITDSDCREFSRMQPSIRVIHAGYAYVQLKNELLVDKPVVSECVCPNLLYIGTGGLPNVDAVIVLLQEIVPLLDELTKMNYRLHIVGDVCNAVLIKDLFANQNHSNIFLHGILPGCMNIYKNMDIVCNPVRFGGGIKIKNIEAIANHCVLVTTSEGARGLPSFKLPYFFCFDKPEEQAIAIAQLINRPSLLAQYKTRTVGAADLCLSGSSVYRELDNYILQL